MADPRLLAVHGYEIYPDGRFSKLLERVCQLAAKIHDKYDYIILLGGQHLHGVSTTLDTEMETRLLELGVPGYKLKPWSRLCPGRRPPRDTMEEVDLLPHLLRALGISPQKTKIPVACVWYFRWRIRFLLRNRNATVGKIHAAPSVDLVRMAIEVIAYLSTRLWPDGQAPIFQKNRASRNVFPARPDGQPWQDNVPAAWDAIPARH